MLHSLTLSHRLRRPDVVWWAVLVALIGAFAVPLAHAGAGMGGAGSIEVCTSNGPQTIAQDSGAGHEFIPYLAHCAFCLHATDRLAPPPQGFAPLYPLAGSVPAPIQHPLPVASPQSAAMPPPRGPPLRFLS